MMIELLLLLVLILLNGVLAMSEAAMIAARPTRLQERADGGDAGAAAALQLAEEPTRFLSTIQIGITLVGIFLRRDWRLDPGAAAGTGLCQHPRPGPLQRDPQHRPGGRRHHLSLAGHRRTGPQAVGAQPGRSHRLPGRPAHAGFLPADGPGGVPAEYLDWLVLTLLGISTSDDMPVTEGEVKSMLEEGAKAGSFEVAEQRMAENVFRMDEWEVRALMTPYPDMVWLDLEAPEAEIISRMMETHHDTYPVFHEGHAQSGRRRLDQRPVGAGDGRSAA